MNPILVPPCPLKAHLLQPFFWSLGSAQPLHHRAFQGQQKAALGGRGTPWQPPWPWMWPMPVEPLQMIGWTWGNQFAGWWFWGAMPQPVWWLPRASPPKQPEASGCVKGTSHGQKSIGQQFGFSQFRLAQGQSELSLGCWKQLGKYAEMRSVKSNRG